MAATAQDKYSVFLTHFQALSHNSSQTQGVPDASSHLALSQTYPSTPKTGSEIVAWENVD
jgi:hypothetical protein